MIDRQVGKFFPGDIVKDCDGTDTIGLLTHVDGRAVVYRVLDGEMDCSPPGTMCGSMTDSLQLLHRPSSTTPTETPATSSTDDEPHKEETTVDESRPPLKQLPNLTSLFR